jgi:hypothetical protein
LRQSIAENAWSPSAENGWQCIAENRWQCIAESAWLCLLKLRGYITLKDDTMKREAGVAVCLQDTPRVNPLAVPN